MTGEELVHEIQDVLKGLLKQGAKLPKNLMLYVKDMIFFDGATTALAPDVNLFDQVTRIYGYFATHHAERIVRDVGLDPRLLTLDLEGVKRSLGVDEDDGVADAARAGGAPAAASRNGSKTVGGVRNV